MSARPALALLPPEELDLLISRSLDGDLSAEEQDELERYLATDPDARRRRDELASLVQSVRELPAPEPPFALATRVNAQVGERANGVAAAWNRLGIYPPAGVVPALVVLALAGVVVATVLGTRAPVRPPQAAPADHDAPVRVFFQDTVAQPRWDVIVLGEAPAWKLASSPTTRPDGAVDATYRLSLTADGHVASLKPAAPGTNVRADVAQLLRGLVFEPVGSEAAPRSVDVRIVAR